MALVKTSKIARDPAKALVAQAGSAPAMSPPSRSAGAAAPRERKATERLAAATGELAAGLVEAAAAAQQLGRSMEQIAAGGEEAAGAAQEQLAAVSTMLSNLALARAEADTSQRLTETAQRTLAEMSAQIITSVRAVEQNAQRQQASLTTSAELDNRTLQIGEITSVVSRISDQTNLLALNAAIEAARAGDHGRGFAVVAEEVRALAEASEKSANDVQALVTTIGGQVREIVKTADAAAKRATTEALSGKAVVETLTAMRHDLAAMAEGSREALTVAAEMERAAGEARKAAGEVASAAEEQAAAAGQAQVATQEQAKALDQGRTAAAALAELTEQLRIGRGGFSAAEQVASSAEQLSATIQEMSGAAAQIMTAVAQITRGAQVQAAATQQTSAALSQIERRATLAQTGAATASQQVATMQVTLAQSRSGVVALVDGVSQALDETRASLARILDLKGLGRRVSKVVDNIALVAVQTSMLAVSGAVEAARAGDAGRGFVVVSGDIRALAREVAESASQISDMVASIMEQISALGNDLERITATGQMEIDKSRLVFPAMDQVDVDITGMAQSYGAIERSSQATLGAAGDIAAGARQIATAAEQASAAARQASIAASEQGRGAEDLAAAIEEIASLAGELGQHGG